MTSPDELRGRWDNEKKGSRKIAFGAGTAPIGALGALLLIASVVLPPHAHSNSLDAQVESKLADLDVKPGTVELTTQKALRVRRAIVDGNFKTASQMATDVLAHSRIQDWQFYPFEDFISAILAKTTPELVHHLKEWSERDRNNALPFLFQAQYFCDSAWLARGSAFSRDVRQDRMAIFVDDLRKALNDVNTAIRLDPHNPYSFYLRLRILHGFGISQDFNASFEEAIKGYPAYYPLYEITLDTLQPRWSGSIPAMYQFVDKFAGSSAQFSPLRLLYLSLYQHLLGTASLECNEQEGNADKTTRCVAEFMRKNVRQGLDKSIREALALYDHTNKYEFGIAAEVFLSKMLTTHNADAYSGAVLELAATAMHSDTQLKEEKTSHNDYIIDELVAQSWHDKGFYDNELIKYQEALTDARSVGFPGEEEREMAIGAIYEQLSATAGEQHQYVDEIAYERAAVLLGLKWDQHYICHGYYELKQYDEAIKTCSEAIASTDNTYARYWRGKAYEQSGQTTLALSDLTNAADADGYFTPYAAVDMSMIHFNLNDNQGALDILNKYTVLYDTGRTEKTQVAIAYNNRCYAHMKLGFLKEALDDCTQSLKYGSIPDAFRKKQELTKRLGLPATGLGGSPASDLASPIR